MGCHTWFSRPITEEEFRLIKEYAPTEIYKLIGNSEENIASGEYDKSLYKNLMKSFKNNIPCVDGQYWWQLGWGTGNSELNGDFIHEIKGLKGLFIDVPEYTDTFRVQNYPRKIITSRHKLRKFLGKKYFDLTDEQLEKVSKFFKENHNGIITFG